MERTKNNNKTPKEMPFRLLKKSLSFLASSFAVLILSGYLTLQPIGEYSNLSIALAGAINNCTDITTLPAYPLTPAVAPGDSGQLDFNAPGAQWQACAPNDSIGINGTRTLPIPGGTRVIANVRFLKGWAWNTNLGDISFSCVLENGVGKNLGQDCSQQDNTQEYGSFIIADTLDSSRIMGFAWGDRTGWISMGCVNSDNMGINCGSPNVPTYGASIALHDGVISNACVGAGPGGSLMAGDIYGSVWSSSVGWMNMCGTHVNLNELNLVDPELNVAVVDDPNGIQARPAGDENIVYANGTDYHEVTVSVTEHGVPVAPGPTRVVTINYTDNYTNNEANKIKADQVTPCAPGACDTNTIIKTPFMWDGARQLYYMRVSSVAPTDADNKYVLHTLTVSVANPLSNNELVGTSVSNFEQEMAFAQPVEVTHISGVDGNNATLVAETFEMTPNANAKIRVKAQLKTAVAMPATNAIGVMTHTYACTPNYSYIFDANNNNSIFAVDGVTPEDVVLTDVEKAAFPNFTRPNECSQGGTLSDGINKMLSVFVPGSANPNCSAPANEACYNINSHFIGAGVPDASEVNALALQTMVSYTRPADATHAAPYRVAYYSRQLKDGSLSSQAAKVDGNVSLNVIDSSQLPAQNWISQAVGEKTNSSREPFLRAIKEVLGGKNGMSFDAGELKVLRSADMVVAPAQQAPGVLYYKHNQGLNACMIIITQNEADALSEVAVNRPVTLVTEGCNIFIDRNITAAKNGNTLVGNLGIIALEDYKIQGANKGGNVYICNAVSDIEANMVLEGSVYSYTTQNANCGGLFLVTRNQLLNADGTPKQANVQRALLAKQLAIVGSLLSNNTYGGSLKAAPNGPLLGDGRIASNAEEVQLSRMQDLNFLRYGKVVTKDIFGAPTQCWADDFPLSKLLNPLGKTPQQNCEDTENTPDYMGTVNIKYRAAPSGQPVFSLLK